MIRISVEVQDGADRFDVKVRAESIRRAVGLARRRYPDGNVREKFPIDPEDFFAERYAARARTAGFDRQDRVAA